MFLNVEHSAQRIKIFFKVEIIYMHTCVWLDTSNLSIRKQSPVGMYSISLFTNFSGVKNYSSCKCNRTLKPHEISYLHYKSVCVLLILWWWCGNGRVKRKAKPASFGDSLLFIPREKSRKRNDCPVFSMKPHTTTLL